MNQNKVIRFLLPLVAVAVIIEAVVLVSNLTKRNKVEVVKEGEKTTQQEVVKTENQVKEFEVVVNGEGEMEVGKTGKVEVILEPKNDKQLDALNLYVKYDPKSFDIKNLEFDESLPKPSFSKVSTAKGLVVVNFLITEATGYKVFEGKPVTLVTFDATPKSKGEFVFDLSTGKDSKESATMFVETETSKVLPYGNTGLNVTVK